ncbi:MAG: hypothetical protein ACI9H8_000326 [Lysobacterales bacterium]|jgi:hypothetical protein
MVKKVNKTTFRSLPALACLSIVLVAACSSQPTKQSGVEPSEVEIIELSSPSVNDPEPAPIGTEQSSKPDIPAEPAVENSLPSAEEEVAVTEEVILAPVPALVPVAVPEPELVLASVPTPEPEQTIQPEPAPPTAPTAVPAIIPETPETEEPPPENSPVLIPATAEPTLDMETLETGLRKTKAIGLFTKLELKSQVEDLLDELEDYHNAKSTYSLVQLEEHFNLLVMKLMILLQDDDPQLHRQIVQARPALWTTLADPTQFTTIKGP